MIPFIVLIIALLVFRALGALGVDAFGSWPDAARYALAMLFGFTAATRLTPIREDLNLPFSIAKVNVRQNI